MCLCTILHCAEEACPTSAKESHRVNARKISLADEYVSNKPVVKLDI